MYKILLIALLLPVSAISGLGDFYFGFGSLGQFDEEFTVDTIDSASACTTIAVANVGDRCDSIVSVGAIRYVVRYPDTVMVYSITENRIDSVFFSELAGSPQYAADTVYDAHSLITAPDGLTADSGASLTFIATVDAGYVGSWPGGTVVAGVPDTLDTVLTSNITLTLTALAIPSVDSARCHVRRATDWDYCRILDTITLYCTDIGDSGALSTSWIDGGMTIPMVVTRWFNTAGIDSIWAVVPDVGATLYNHYFRSRIRTAAGVFNTAPTAHTLFVKKYVRP